MFDQGLKKQLEQAFQPLENLVELVYFPSPHPDQNELVQMLQAVAETSEKIQVSEDPSAQAPIPTFYIRYKGQRTGVTFRGIPGGHEFTSLILAILHTDGKAKRPDPKLIERIQRLKGPVRIQTYISLTCENCPDVVQSLNLMALVHSDFQHEMVDGGYAQNEIDQLGIQGVPSLVSNGKMFHSGKINLLELIGKLEQIFGTSEAPKNYSNEKLGDFDVAVIGGGPAGISAAIYSVRKGLKTAIVAEKFGGQVQETKGIENLISVPYTEGPQLAGQLVDHASKYPIKQFEHRRVSGLLKGSPHTIQFDSGESLTAKSVIVATGARWRELGVPGEKEYLGRGVAFCPHCDGPFYKGKKVAVVGGGNSGVEAAIDLGGIVGEVVLIEYNEALKADQVLVDRLKSMPNVSILTNVKTLKMLGDGQKVNGLEYQERATDAIKKLDLDGVFIQIGLLSNSQFVKGVLDLTSFGEIIVDEKCRTSVPGIYAAGDVTTTPYKQIIIAMGEGAKAALASFEDRIKSVF